MRPRGRVLAVTVINTVSVIPFPVRKPCAVHRVVSTYQPRLVSRKIKSGLLPDFHFRIVFVWRVVDVHGTADRSSGRAVAGRSGIVCAVGELECI